MAICELSLEIGYPKRSFDLVKIGRSLSSFAKLVGGDHAELVMPLVSHGSTYQNGKPIDRQALAKLKHRLLKGSLHLRIAFYFPFHEELIEDLAQVYQISFDKAGLFSNGNNISLGYATALLSCYEERATLLILPDIDRFGHVMMTSLLVHSHLVNFCRETEAVEAFWENDEEEIVMTVWPTVQEDHADSAQVTSQSGTFVMNGQSTWHTRPYEMQNATI